MVLIILKEGENMVKKTMGKSPTSSWWSERIKIISPVTATASRPTRSKVRKIKAKKATRHVAKKIVAKKHIAKKIMAKKHIAKKIVAKKHIAKKIMAKKHIAKKMVAKKHIAKKMVAKKPVARKVVAKKSR